MSKKDDIVKILLPESEIPKTWYNIAADIPGGLPPMYNPQTNKPLVPSDLENIFCKEIIEQEISSERFIDIPDKVRDQYRSFRPSPLFRARGLEKAIGTNCRIYYKYEGGNATGSHKLNTALAQAYYNKAAGIKRISTETGAGQWGTAISMACGIYDMDCTVYMVKVSYNQKPYRRSVMKTFGADIYASPSELTQSGRAILAKDPDCTGSLGIAISEAVEDAMLHSDTNYALGSVNNHVCMHQTLIGLESKRQLEYIDEYPDVVIACCGGGTNFSGLAFPFLADKFKGTKVRAIAVEPESCPTLTKGVYDYDYGDVVKMTPIMRMYTLGHEFIPSGIHAGGLRYHGDSPIVSKLYHDGFIEAKAYPQRTVFDAAVTFARTEGIVPAPESSHAIRGAIDEALMYDQKGEEKSILFCLSGNGYFDMAAYDTYFSGEMQDSAFNSANIESSLSQLPKICE